MSGLNISLDPDCKIGVDGCETWVGDCEAWLDNCVSCIGNCEVCVGNLGGILLFLGNVECWIIGGGCVGYMSCVANHCKTG